MKKFLFAIVVLAIAFAPALSASTDKVSDIATILSGTFEGSTPSNNLRFDLRPAGIDPAHPYDLFLRVSGRLYDVSVHREGVIRLEQFGNDIYFSYTPHFEMSLSSRSAASAGNGFTEEEVNATCGFTLKPRGDGFAGETLGSTSCVMAMPGAIGKWTVEVDPTGLRIRNATSGETLRFKRTDTKNP